MKFRYHLLSYVMLLTLIAGGWFSVLAIEERTKISLDQLPSASSRLLSVDAGKAFYGNKKTRNYGLTYESAVFLDGGRGSATAARLTAFDGETELFFLAAPLVNSSSPSQWIFSQGARMESTRDELDLRAHSIEIDTRKNTVIVKKDARLQQRNLVLTADTVVMTAFATDERILLAIGMPVTFSRQELRGHARRVRHKKANEELWLHGDAYLEDTASERRLKARDIFIEEQGDVIHLYGDADLQREEAEMQAEIIHINRSSVEASGSPAAFRQGKWRGEAEDIRFRQDDLSLEGRVLLRDEERRLKAEKIVVREEDITMEGDAEITQEDIFISGNRIRSIGSDTHRPHIEADGDPVHFRQAGLSLNGSVLIYDDNNAIINGTPLAFTYEDGRSLLNGTGTFLVRRAASQTLLLRGEPVDFHYEDESLRVRGRGSSLMTDMQNNNMLLKGKPAHLEKRTEEAFRIQAEEIEWTAEEIVFTGAIRMQDKTRNITAERAIYERKRGNWQLQGENTANGSNRIEITLPTR